MNIEKIEIPPLGVKFVVGGAEFHLMQDGERVSVRCSDGGEAANGDRLFTHMPAGNVVLIEIN